MLSFTCRKFYDGHTDVQFILLRGQLSSIVAHKLKLGLT